MDLHILSRTGALNFEPIKLTYAIRIYSSDPSYKPSKLKESRLYSRIVEYVFDVVDDDCEDGQISLCATGTVALTEDVAHDLLIDFSKHKEGIEALMVHCSAGKERSPAVAIALNDIFNLGHNSEELKTKFFCFDNKTYETLLRVGAKGFY